MIDLTIGWQFDLALVVLALALVGAYMLWRWATFGRYERWHRRQIEQHLAEVGAPAVRVPINSHEGDWDWPRRLESHRLRDS